MKLRPVKLTKDGKCTQCGHELKAKWEAYADEKQQVYCRYCAPKLDDRTDPASLELLNTTRLLLQQNKAVDTSEPTPDDLPF